MPRFRRRYYYFDEQAESFDEMMNPCSDEEYIDYRTYPIKIDWTEVENEESEACEIFDKYGYIGIALYNSLSRIKHLKLSSEKFHKNIIEFYCKNIEKSCNESIKTAKNFVECLPDLKLIKEIIQANPINKKELTTFKIILDIYEHFYKNYERPLYTNLLYDYIPTATIFYSNISEEDVKYIFEKLGSFSNRNIYDGLITNIKATINKNKSEYMDHFENLKRTLTYFVGDIDKIKLYR